MKKIYFVGLLLVIASLLVLSGCSSGQAVSKGKSSVAAAIPCGGSDSTHACITDGTNNGAVLYSGNEACRINRMTCNRIEFSCHNVVGGTPRWIAASNACYDTVFKSNCAYRAVCTAIPIATNTTNSNTTNRTFPINATAPSAARFCYYLINSNRLPSGTNYLGASARMYNGVETESGVLSNHCTGSDYVYYICGPVSESGGGISGNDVEGVAHRDLNRRDKC